LASSPVCRMASRRGDQRRDGDQPAGSTQDHTPSPEALAERAAKLCGCLQACAGVAGGQLHAFKPRRIRPHWCPVPEIRGVTASGMHPSPATAVSHSLEPRLSDSLIRNSHICPTLPKDRGDLNANFRNGTLGSASRMYIPRPGQANGRGSPAALSPAPSIPIPARAALSVVSRSPIVTQPSPWGCTLHFRGRGLWLGTGTVLRASSTMPALTRLFIYLPICADSN